MMDRLPDRGGIAGLSPGARSRLARALRAEDAAAPEDEELTGAGWTGAEGALRPDAGLLFGCDVGGTKVQSVLCDLSGRVLAEARDATPRAEGEAVVEVIARHLSTLSGDHPGAVLAAGIGLPGTIHPVTGRLSRAPNLPDLPGGDIRAALTARLGLPVAVENDVTLAALGECWRGHGAGDRAVQQGGLAFIALGTGIGMGLAWGDRLLRGAHGAAGEIAWLPIGGDPADPQVRACGALESTVAGQALVESYRARGGTRPGSLRELSRDGAGDAALDAVLQELALRTARAVLSVEALLDPALIVFGGGIGSDAALLPRIEAELARISPAPSRCRISLLGNRAGALGAVRAAMLTLATRLEEPAA